MDEDEEFAADHPARVLTEEVDPQQRAHAHLALAKRAELRGDELSAQEHLSAAGQLAPQDAAVQAALLRQRVRSPAPAGKGGLLGRWLGNWRRA